MISGRITLVLCTLICLGACLLRRQCSNRRVPYQPTYTYFGTKTLYYNAAKYMESERASDLPKSFSHKSLKEINDHLIEKNCSPVNLYFLGRHSARFPERDDIIEYKNYVQELKSKLKPLVNEGDCSSDAKLREQLIASEFLMKPEQGNMITDLGAKEELAIAQRMRTLFPIMLSGKSANINIGVTGKVRTQQTAVAFLSAIDDFTFPGCNRFSTKNITDPQYSIDSIDSECLKAIENQYKRSDLLDFHTLCKNIRSRNSKEEKWPLLEKVKNPDNIQFIVDSVQKRLAGLNLTPKDIKNFHSLCKYEIAIKGSSIWCSLFDDNHLRALEYISDMDDYLKDAYGPEVNAASACPVIKDLLLSFEKTTKGNDSGSHSDDDKQKLKTQLYFTHAPALAKLLAAFGLFKDEENFVDKVFDEFLESKTPPAYRQWRSSLVVPFSANIAFYLYKCDKRHGPEYKLVTSVSEKPVKIRGCKHKVCDLDEFIESYKSELQCDLTQVCSRA